MKTKFYNLASELYNKRIFDLLKMGTLFAVKVKEDTYYCVIEEDSIFMYKNQRGFESWIDLISQEDEVSDLKALELEYMKYGLSISFSSFEDLNKYELKEIKNLELHYDNTGLVPRFMHHDELTMPFRIKEEDFPAINAVLLTLQDILENNFTLFEEDEKILEEEEFEDDEVEETINCSTFEDDKLAWSRVELPDDFDRFPSPTLQPKELSFFNKCRRIDKEWNLHLFIVPNANENKAHIFPIAGVLYENESRNILAYRLVREWDNYYQDFLEELADAVEEFGKPSVINVSSSRAEILISGFCDQLDIPVLAFSSLEDTDSLEVQLIKNFNY